MDQTERIKLLIYYIQSNDDFDTREKNCKVHGDSPFVNNTGQNVDDDDDDDDKDGFVWL